jgi:hypothetical protein
MNKLQQATLKSLRPTQLTVGILEVVEKRKRLAALTQKAQQEFLEAHPMPAVIGLEGKLYITDHHHLARAAWDAGIDAAFCVIEADLSALDEERFWPEMNKNSWVHPLDQNGVRHRYVSIPSQVGQLVDDVYRSLAGFVRDAGGFDKTHTAFAEFIWADFFRRNVSIEDVTADFHQAVKDAERLAKSPLAKGIPGFKAS